MTLTCIRKNAKNNGKNCQPEKEHLVTTNKRPSVYLRRKYIFLKASSHFLGGEMVFLLHYKKCVIRNLFVAKNIYIKQIARRCKGYFVLCYDKIKV